MESDAACIQIKYCLLKSSLNVLNSLRFMCADEELVILFRFRVIEAQIHQN